MAGQTDYHPNHHQGGLSMDFHLMKIHVLRLSLIPLYSRNHKHEYFVGILLYPGIHGGWYNHEHRHTNVCTEACQSVTLNHRDRIDYTQPAVESLFNH